MKKTLGAVFALFLVLGLSGCETTKGFGKDLQSAGKSIEETAKKNQ